MLQTSSESQLPIFPSVSQHFSILLNENMSLRELQDLNKQGYSIIRSAHVGNLRTSNLVILEQGFTVIVQEYLSSNEPNYLPSCIILNNTNSQISTSSDKIALWLECNNKNKEHKKFISPVHIHVNAAKKRWKNVVELSNFVLRLGEEKLEQILNKFFSVSPNSAHAYIDETGEKYLLTFSNGIFISQTGKKFETPEVRKMLLDCFNMTFRCLKYNENPTPTVIPNTEALIVLTTICDLINPDKIYAKENIKIANVYHLAGVKMIDYLERNSKTKFKFLEEINLLYKAARDIIPTLPEKVIFNLIPTGELSRAVTISGKEPLNELIKAYAKYKKICREIQISKGVLLEQYQKKINSIDCFEDIKRLVDEFSKQIPVILMDPFFQTYKFNEEFYKRDPVRVKKGIIGIIAKNLQSTEINLLVEQKDALIMEMKRMKSKGVLIPNSITQYDIAALKLDKDSTIFPQSLLLLSSKELKNIFDDLTRITNE